MITKSERRSVSMKVIKGSDKNLQPEKWNKSNKQE
jgi:hypothetical protein